MIKTENLGFSSPNFSLKNVSFSVGDGEYFVLLGPTGSGKTLLLKNIAGLIKPAAGRIFFDGKDITLTPPEDRNFGYMAQDYRLFPNLSVRGNVSFSPRLGALGPARAAGLAASTAATLGISGLMDRGVAKLSGGERQRVALARALLSMPKAMLLDEPFSAIDAGLKQHLWFEIKNALLAAGMSVIHVTHDIEEAMTLGEKIAVIIDGEIRQSGRPDEILLRPSSESIARYLGIKNIFPGTVTQHFPAPAPGSAAKIVVEFLGTAVTALFFGAPPAPGEKATVCVRPQSVKIIREGEPVRAELADNLFKGEITKTYFFSDSASVFVKCGGVTWESRFPQAIYRRNQLTVGKTVAIALWQPDIMVYR